MVCFEKEVLIFFFLIAWFALKNKSIKLRIIVTFMSYNNKLYLICFDILNFEKQNFWCKYLRNFKVQTDNI